MLSWTATLRGCLCSMMLAAIGGVLFPIAVASRPVGFADRHLFVDAAPPAVYVTPDHAVVRSRFVDVDAGLLGDPELAHHVSRRPALGPLDLGAAQLPDDLFRDASLPGHLLFHSLDPRNLAGSARGRQVIL
jgi:hypothetical protein